MTAQATTGPASGPRPTSSMPAMRCAPRSRSCRSNSNRSTSPLRLAVRLGRDVAVLDLGGFFALASTEVVKFGTTDPALGFHLDFVDAGRMQGKDPLHALAVGNA